MKYARSVHEIFMSFEIGWIIRFGYSLHLHRNTEPRCKHGSSYCSGVLLDICGL